MDTKIYTAIMYPNDSFYVDPKGIAPPIPTSERRGESHVVTVAEIVIDTNEVVKIKNVLPG